MGGLGEGGDARVEPLLEDVTRRDVLRVLVPQEEIGNLWCRGSAADEREPHTVVGPLHARPRARRCRRQHRQSGGRAQEVPPRQILACLADAPVSFLNPIVPPKPFTD